MSLDLFLGFGTDACAVLDPDGRIAVVNDVWRRRASAAGATATTGPRTDYLAVCRRAARDGAPQADVALRTIESALAGQEAPPPFVYPCTTPGGTHWFRADVVAAGGSGQVGVRHVDITGQFRVRGGGLFDTATVLMTAAGLRLAVADALDGPPHPAVLLLVTDLPARGESDTALAIGAAAAAGEHPVDTVARLDDHLVALLVTAPDTTTAMATADDIVHGVARETGWALTRWAIAPATAGDDADRLLARARRALLRRLDGRDASTDRQRFGARLQTAASLLTEAVADFDRALDDGLDLLRLRELDHRVDRAERACAEAGLALVERDAVGPPRRRSP